ncbi:MAG TPA: hypothetical protein VM925_14940 [Labilithrix sp.]|nr:hypothetical protein [Labilithrix sp.]
MVKLEDPGTPDTYKLVPAGAIVGDGRLVVVGRRPTPSSGPPFIVRLWE